MKPATYRRITLGALVALFVIVVTGGAVRLTGSGLGCPDWPTCADSRVVPVAEAGYHAMVEFVNRAFTGVVSMAVILAVLGSLVRLPRRGDLVWLSLGLVAGVVAQIVLGGLTVLFELKPQFVMGHFLLSMVLLANATVLHERAGRDLLARTDRPDLPEGEPREPSRRSAAYGRAAVVLAALVLVLGTVVTSSGPHGGDPDAERFSFALPDVARLHGLAVVGFLGLMLAAWLHLDHPGSSRVARRWAGVVLMVGLAQAGIGYVQYFTGVPVLLVGAHIAGAALLWVATVRFAVAATAAPPVRGGKRRSGVASPT